MAEKRLRISLTLDQTTMERLERWAGIQKRAIANMAQYLVEIAVEAAIASGELDEELATGDRAIRSVLLKIVNGEQLTTSEAAIAADELGIDANVLIYRANKSREANGERSNC